MEMTKQNGKFVMNHENLLYGIEYVISFMNEVKTVTSKRLKYYKYPQFIFIGISKFYPYQSKTGISATAQIIAFRDEFDVQSLRNLQDY